MDSSSQPIRGDPNLRALIENIVQQAAITNAEDRNPLPSAGPTNLQALNQPKLTIEQQITQLRKQLSESYNLFMSARDSLASISFLNLDKQMASKTAAAMATANAHLNAATDNLEFSGESVAFLMAMRHRVGDVPEVATFFRVVARLQEGMKRMEVNHKLWSELNEDVNGAVMADRGYVDDVRKRLDEKVSPDELELAERMVDEAIAAEK